MRPPANPAAGHDGPVAAARVATGMPLGLLQPYPGIFHRTAHSTISNGAFSLARLGASSRVKKRPPRTKPRITEALTARTCRRARVTARANALPRWYHRSHDTIAFLYACVMPSSLGSGRAPPYDRIGCARPLQRRFECIRGWPSQHLASDWKTGSPGWRLLTTRGAAAMKLPNSMFGSISYYLRFRDRAFFWEISVKFIKRCHERACWISSFSPSPSRAASFPLPRCRWL